MSKAQKALDKLLATPTPAGIKWEELTSALEGLGYRQLKGRGARRKFHHSEKNDLIICHAPHPSPDVDKGCIADVAEHLRSKGFCK